MHFIFVITLERCYDRLSLCLALLLLDFASYFNILSVSLACVCGDRFGIITAFILPPSKTVALIEFAEPTEARAAFKGLAYRKYKHVPLYLEWAPVGIIDRSKAKSKTLLPSHLDMASSGNGSDDDHADDGSDDAEDAEEEDGDRDGKRTSKKATKGTGAETVAEEDADALDDYSTLYVKNLSFSTTEEGLKAYVTRMGVGQGLRVVSIPTKAKGDAKLSMGFGFLEFASSAHAHDALSTLNHSVLDGHTLEIKPSDKRLSATRANPAAIMKRLQEQKKPLSKKLIVRNVAFQATQTELRALFSAFGNVKRVRIPRKIGNVHRGFAFVEMSSVQEALAAMSALTNTHLYGRHLVIEWAKPDEDEDVVEEMNQLRKRARLDARVQSLSTGKRAKATGDQFNDLPSMADIY